MLVGWLLNREYLEESSKNSPSLCISECRAVDTAKFKSHCVAILLPSLSAEHHHQQVHFGGPVLLQWPATAMILISPELSCLAVELISGSHLLPLPPKFPLVLPEQSAYEKFIQSLFHWGRLSHFICHYLIAYGKHAGRPKCVGLGFPLPFETVDISFIS